MMIKDKMIRSLFLLSLLFSFSVWGQQTPTPVMPAGGDPQVIANWTGTDAVTGNKTVCIRQDYRGYSDLMIYAYQIGAACSTLKIGIFYGSTCYSAAGAETLPAMAVPNGSRVLTPGGTGLDFWTYQIPNVNYSVSVGVWSTVASSSCQLQVMAIPSAFGNTKAAYGAYEVGQTFTAGVGLKPLPVAGLNASSALTPLSLTSSGSANVSQVSGETWNVAISGSSKPPEAWMLSSTLENVSVSTVAARTTLTLATTDCIRMKCDLDTFFLFGNSSVTATTTTAASINAREVENHCLTTGMTYISFITASGTGTCRVVKLLIP